jgi:hypothetical protein
MGRKRVYGTEVVNLMKGCVGWEHGKTSREIAQAVYGNEMEVGKALGALRNAKNYFANVTPPMILHSRAKKIKTNGASKLEWRWFLVSNTEEAWHADDILILRIDRTTHQLRLQMPILNGYLTTEQKADLVKRLGAVAINLQLPAGTKEAKVE